MIKAIFLTSMCTLIADNGKRWQSTRAAIKARKQGVLWGRGDRPRTL